MSQESAESHSFNEASLPPECVRAREALSNSFACGLAPSAAAELEAHLAACPECREARDQWAADDSALRSAFSAERAGAERAAAAAIQALSRGRARPNRSLRWLTHLVAAAAGFAVAYFAFQMWSPRAAAISDSNQPGVNPASHPATAPASRPAAAHLAVAAGVIECRNADTEAWATLGTGADLPDSAQVRTTAGARCELALADGSELRLNENSEARVGIRGFELREGRAWTQVAKASEPFDVRCGDATFTALGTRFDLERKPTGADLLVIEGAVKVQAAADIRTVGAGRRLSVDGAAIGQEAAVYDMMRETRWIDEILILKGKDNPELADRVNDLLAELGQTKMSYMCEADVRSLGSHCEIPLVRYIQSNRSKDESNRRIAADILADVCTTAVIPDLIGLLADQDGRIRADSQRALHRLTNERQGGAPETVEASEAEGLRAQSAWSTWWDANKVRFPGADAVLTKDGPTPRGSPPPVNKKG